MRLDGGMEKAMVALREQRWASCRWFIYPVAGPLFIIMLYYIYIVYIFIIVLSDLHLFDAWGMVETQNIWKHHEVTMKG